MILSSTQKFHVATFIAILFHVAGCIGMFGPFKDWFIQSTPVTLCIMFLLLVWTHQQKTKNFLWFIATCFITGLVTEMIGVNTGFLFGNYIYGNVLGPKVNQVPWFIGINWFVVVYCSGSIVSQFHEWLEQKYALVASMMSSQLKIASIIVDGALLATFFDFIMEPVATKLGYWTWLPNGVIPIWNYVCWFAVSALLLWVFARFKVDGRNKFAVHLLIIQTLFFGLLRTFL